MSLWSSKHCSWLIRMPSHERQGRNTPEWAEAQFPIGDRILLLSPPPSEPQFYLLTKASSDCPAAKTKMKKALSWYKCWYTNLSHLQLLLYSHSYKLSGAESSLQTSFCSWLSLSGCIQVALPHGCRLMGLYADKTLGWKNYSHLLYMFFFWGG